MIPQQSQYKALVEALLLEDLFRYFEIVEVKQTFLDRAGEIVHLGLVGLPVGVLEEEESAFLLGVVGSALQPLDHQAHRAMGMQIRIVPRLNPSENQYPLQSTPMWPTVTIPARSWTSGRLRLVTMVLLSFTFMVADFAVVPRMGSRLHG